jgi:hypothetical protein
MVRKQSPDNLPATKLKSSVTKILTINPHNRGNHELNSFWWVHLRGEPTTILAISMKMKSHGKSLGRNSLTDAPYRNPGMVLNGQGPGHHPLGGALYLDLDTVLSEQGSSQRILTDALHRRLGVVKNEQGSSHLTRRMRRVRKLAESSRVRVGT